MCNAIDYSEEPDIMVPVCLKRTEVFTIEDWKDIETFGDESKEFYVLYGKEYQITLEAYGEIPDDIIHQSDYDRLKRSVVQDEEYLQLQYDLKNIQSELTRRLICYAFLNFLNVAFPLTLYPERNWEYIN